MNIKIKMADQEKVVHLLNETAEKCGDLSAPLADLGERLVRKIGARLSGGVLSARSGRLRGSLTYSQAPRTLTVSAGGGPHDVRYARIHQFGGTITAKKGKFLTIPFPGGPADKPVPLRARDFTNIFFAKGIMFQRRRGEKRPVPLFILKRSVRIPARPYMEIDESDISYLNRSILDYVAGGWGR